MKKLATGIALFLFAASLDAQVWTWQHPFPQANNLNAVALFANNTVLPPPLPNGTGYAVGDGGTILKTTNFGAAWTLQNSGTLSNLYAVCISPTDTLRALAAG